MCLLEPFSKMSFGLPPFGGIGASFKILNILQYASGFKLGLAAILNQNPIFEMGSSFICLIGFIGLVR
jgi:hypothetical protein